MEYRSRHGDELREMVLPPEKLGKALQDPGAPPLFGELNPPVPDDTAFWASENRRLMRNRFTLEDLLFFLGWRDDAFVEGLFEKARGAGGGPR